VPETWTILAALEWTTEFFKRCRIESARLDAEILLAQVLGAERIQLYINYNKPLQSEELNQFKQIIKRRAKREPIAYIVGQKEFWSMSFKVNPSVLIPRPETELLVQILLDLSKNKDQRSPQISSETEKSEKTVLEIGTGSGNIAISLAKEMRNYKILAGDISPQAIELAQENAALCGIDGNLRFYEGDLFEAFGMGQLDEKAAFIVSNPPYIPTAQLAGLAPEVGFEPRIALDGGIDGIKFQRKIIEESPNFLIPGGYLIMETVVFQANDLAKTGRSDPRWADFRIMTDYSGLPRVVLGRRS
jgi:release factor glutamine methyltransferase